ncbi:MAG: DEAD/DEAH box helicase [Prevotella sp.]|jgi:ATP-independent RNA helicase DbpA
MKSIVALTRQLKITLNEMQKATVEAMADRKNDIILLSPTGSGKTLAYLLPLTQMLDEKSDDVQAVIIVPGRELALQSCNVLKDIKSGLRTYACYGGRPAMDEHREMRDLKPQVVFGTPGRLIDHIEKDNIEVDKVRCVVLDEFDKCLEMGFRQELSQLTSLLPVKARRVLLSATDAAEIPYFVDLKQTKTLNFLPEEESPVSRRVSTYFYRSDSKDKLEALSLLLRSWGDASTIVFVNYRDAVERTADYLQQQGFSVIAYHGGLDQKDREEALFKFECGAANVLVSTDLGSRGIDIPDLQYVVHYHLPETEDNYIHRVGRTARWDAEGNNIFLLGPDEELPSYAEKDAAPYVIGEVTDAPAPQRMAIIYIGKGKRDKLSKFDIVGFFCKTGGLTADEIGRIQLHDHYAYMAVKSDKLDEVLKKVQGRKIKGLKTLFEPVRC